METPERPSRRAAPRHRNQEFELRGPLQVEVMAVLWKLGAATINDIRAEQHWTKRRAYTTVQTVLDRLVDRGLVGRKRNGKSYVYRPRYDEAEFLARKISRQLAATFSPESGRDALVRLVGELSQEELEHILRTVANR